MKNRLGRVPYLLGFYENREVDPLVIIREYKTYQFFLEAVEKELYTGKMLAEEMLILEYLSKTILSGARPYELEILKRFLHSDEIHVSNMIGELQERYGHFINAESFENAVKVLQGHFVSKEEEYNRYRHIDIIEGDLSYKLQRMNGFAK